MNRQHDIIVEPADGRAELWAAHRLWTIDGDLRGNLQPVLLRRHDIDPRHGGVLQAAGRGQYNNRRERIEPVGLNNDSVTQLTAVPLLAACRT